MNKKSILISSICGIVGVLIIAIFIFNFNSEKKEELSLGDTTTSCKWKFDSDTGWRQGVCTSYGTTPSIKPTDGSSNTPDAIYLYCQEYKTMEECNDHLSSVDKCYRVITYKNECTTTEEPIKVTNIRVSINNPSAVVEVGKSYNLNAEISPSNADDKSVTWSSSNSNIVIVNQSGGIQVKNPGNVVITATAKDGSQIKGSITLNSSCSGNTTEYNGQCVSCSAGEYFDYDVSKKCTPCPKGTYTSTSNVSTQCTSCTGNTYQDLTGQTSCKTCEGTVSSNNTSCTIERCYCSSDCSSCIWSSSQTSTYNREVAATSEDDCKKKIVCYEGYKKSSDGKSCEKCGTGKYCENGTEYNCPEGYYCENGRKTICPKDSYCPSGSSQAISCSTGKSNQFGEWITSGTGKTNQDACVLSCPAGRYPAVNSECNLCESGWYCPGGTVGPFQCSDNKTSSQGAKSEYECYDVNKRHCYCNSTTTACSWQDTGGGAYTIARTDVNTEFECFNLPASKCAENNQILDNGTCVNCPSGKYYNNGRCDTCPAGNYCINGQKTICPKDSYCPSGSSQAISCSTGKSTQVGEWITSGTGKTNQNACLLSCPAGSYVPNGGTECITCKGGKYCEGGTQADEPCPNYYTSDSGAKSKMSCYIDVQAGYGIEVAMGDKSQCSGNTYYPNTRRIYYGNTSKCINCNGMVDNNNLTCSTHVYVVGVIVDIKNVTLNKGESVTITEEVLPSDATDKSVSWTSSDPKVAIVNNGEITAVGGGIATITVKTNDRNKTATVNVRVNCAKGAYFDDEQGVCKECNDRYYCPDGKKKIQCPRGYGYADPGATSELQCYTKVEAGKFVPYPKAEKIDCPVGTYNNELSVDVYYGNATTCTRCPEDTYYNSSSPGAVNSGVCQPCPNGKSSPSGSVSIDKCVSTTVNVTGISVNPNSVILNKGDNATITETVTPSNATNKNVSWTSSRPGVATVTNNGIITAVGGGTATISAVTEDGGKNASVSVTVACDKGSYLKDGSCTPCGVNGVYCPDGINQKKCPQYYNYSDSKSVDITHCYLYTIDGNDGLYVPSPAAAPQKCPAGTYAYKDKVYYGTSNSCTKCPANTYSSIIGATSVDVCVPCLDDKVSPPGSTSKNQCIIKTSVVNVTSISLIPKNSTINVGQTVAMEAKISPENATNKNIKWSSSNLDVATVNENTGFVTSHKEGVATITATSQDGSNISATATITVQKSNLSITCPEIAFVNTNFNCSISSGTIMGAVTSSDSSVAKVLITGSSTFTASAVKTGKVSFRALINGQTVESNIVTINEISLSKITGNDVIAIAADVGSVTGSYGAFNSNNASVEVNWSARGSDVTYTPYTLATSFRATFKHQGSPSASSCPIVTSGTVKATQGNNNKTLSVKVYSYCEWKEIEESNKGPFDSQIGATRDSMKYVVGCDAYEGWYQESGKWYYVNHYNRCCGSTQVVIPEEEYCYIKRGKDTPNAYCYGTTTDCNGYTEKISNINNKESCDEVAACYKNSQGKYVFGKYSGQSGYTYYGKTCPSSTVTYACYANAEKIEDATIVSWATGSSNAYPYLIKGVSEKNCQASACYANSDKTRYVWSTTKPSGYVRVEEINSRSLCKPENEACYLDSNGNYTWGRYAKIDGYTIITSIKNKSECKKPDLTYACYVKDDDYVWSTSKPSGYTLLSKITNPKECVKPEEAACYLHNNEYIWGKYASISGYSLVESIKERAYCVKPTEACYLSPNLKYVWGDYSSDKKYQLIDNITNRDDCITTYVTPESGANISKIILIGILVFGVFGMIFVYQGYNKKKNKMKRVYYS